MKRFPLEASLIGLGAIAALIGAAWLVAPKATNAPQYLLEQAVLEGLDQANTEFEQEVEMLTQCIVSGEITPACQRLMDGN